MWERLSRNVDLSIWMQLCVELVRENKRQISFVLRVGHTIQAVRGRFPDCTSTYLSRWGKWQEAAAALTAKDLEITELQKDKKLKEDAEKKLQVKNLDPEILALRR